MHLSGEMVDTVADYLAIFVLFFVPALLIYLFLQTRQLNTRFELIRVRNDRLANRVALHLALGGGFAPAQTP